MNWKVNAEKLDFYLFCCIEVLNAVGWYTKLSAASCELNLSHKWFYIVEFLSWCSCLIGPRILQSKKEERRVAPFIIYISLHPIFILFFHRNKNLILPFLFYFMDDYLRMEPPPALYWRRSSNKSSDEEVSSIFFNESR